MLRPLVVLFAVVLLGVPSLRAGGPERQPVLEAYKSGKVRLAVEVAPGTTDGGTVHVSVENAGQEALKLVVPKGRTEFPGDTPLETFIIDVPSDKPLDIEKDGASSFAAAQKGKVRALSGTFTLMVSAGKPRLDGRVEAGPVAER
jgi:hypothetical protein